MSAYGDPSGIAPIVRYEAVAPYPAADAQAGGSTRRWRARSVRRRGVCGMTGLVPLLAVVMAVGTVGTIVPLVPGISLVWTAGLVYGLVRGFGAGGVVGSRS